MINVVMATRIVLMTLTNRMGFVVLIKASSAHVRIPYSLIRILIYDGRANVALLEKCV